MTKELHFYKFDGAGNDFVLLDIRHDDIELTTQQIERICHRRFGVGADGLMTLGKALDPQYDFEMKYYNSDGKLGSMCGNGGRCIALFAHLLNLSKEQKLHFVGFDGPHDAEIVYWNEEERIGIVQLGMRDVPCNEIRRCLDGWFLDTGSPHYVQRVENLKDYDVEHEGRRIRHCKEEFPEGTNVDFIEDMPDGTLFVRTYERGVEAETWACGTGVTACAIVSGNGRINTLGGNFKVSFEASGSAYTRILLTGPVALIFEGTYRLM